LSCSDATAKILEANKLMSATHQHSVFTNLPILPPSITWACISWPATCMFLWTKH